MSWEYRPARSADCTTSLASSVRPVRAGGNIERVRRPHTGTLPLLRGGLFPYQYERPRWFPHRALRRSVSRSCGRSHRRSHSSGHAESLSALLPIDSQVSQYNIHIRIVVPGIPRCGLVVPDVFACVSGFSATMELRKRLSPPPGLLIFRFHGEPLPVPI